MDNTDNNKSPAFVKALLAAVVFALVTLFAFLIHVLSIKSLPADHPAVEQTLTR